MRDVETRLLRSFIVVAAKQSVSQGAKRLGWSQGTMSLRISKLEEDLGLQLFKRGRYNFKLTPSGRDLLPDAQALVDMRDRLFDRARKARLGRGSAGLGRRIMRSILVNRPERVRVRLELARAFFAKTRANWCADTWSGSSRAAYRVPSP